MVLSRRLLRVAALGAVFALALAGTALAADGTWKGEGYDPHSWTSLGGNWDGGIPDEGDKATFPKDANITDIGTPFTLRELVFSGNVTLTLGDASNTLTAKKLTVESGKAAVSLEANNAFAVKDSGKSVVDVVEGATLTFQGIPEVLGEGQLQLIGGGTLELKAAMKGVTDLKITDGGTLVAKVGDALRGLTASFLEIDNGSIVVDQENFGGGDGHARTLSMKKGIWS